MTGQQLSGQCLCQKDTGMVPSHELGALEEGTYISPWLFTTAKAKTTEMLVGEGSYPQNSPGRVANSVSLWSLVHTEVEMV